MKAYVNQRKQMSLNSRNKGSKGEREFAAWLKETLDLDFTPKRNLDQVREGGADILDVGDFVFEVKRCEALQHRKWWLQVSKAAKEKKNSIPLVVFRQNRKPWHGLISAKNIGLDYGFIELKETELKKWLRGKYELFRNRTGNTKMLW